MWEIANIATPARLPSVRTVANAVMNTGPSRVTSGVTAVEKPTVKTEPVLFASQSVLSMLVDAALLVTLF